MTEDDLMQRLKTGRNEDCLCGSKKKYKKCHLAADEAAQTAAFARAQADAAEKMKAEQRESGPAPENQPHGNPHDPAHRREKGGPMKVPSTTGVGRQVSAPRKTGTA